VSGSALVLDLDEGERAAAADDEVELVRAHPLVGGQDPVAAQPVVPRRPPLRGSAKRAGGRYAAGASASASSSGR
jgi:hypothetical protein